MTTPDMSNAILRRIISLLPKLLSMLGVLGAFLILRFIYRYMKAVKQFPGPPVKSFWKGNLDQTMADDIHEKWRRWHNQYGPIFQTVSNARVTLVKSTNFLCLVERSMGSYNLHWPTVTDRKDCEPKLAQGSCPI